MIRNALPADVGVLRDLFRRSSLSNEGDREVLLAHPETLEWAGDGISDGRTRVAVADDRVVGFATTIAGDDALELDDLFVDPDCLRQGVGRALVADAAATARRLGCRLDVTANDHALAFYEQVGFVTDGFVDLEFGRGRRMHLAVDPDG